MFVSNIEQLNTLNLTVSTLKIEDNEEKLEQSLVDQDRAEEGL